MEKERVITIAGQPGTGKSTTADLVARALGYERFSSGDFMRTIAAERGITLGAINEAAETDPSIDEAIDGSLKALRGRGGIVIDSRLAFHWLPESFKVYLTASTRTAAERIWKNKDRHRITSGEHAGSVEDIEARIIARLESEKRRYLARYGIDPNDPGHFDLVLDTSIDQPDEIAGKVVTAYEQWLAS